MNPVTTASITTRGGYSSVKSRQPQMQPQQMTDHHHNQRQMLPDQQHIQGYPSQQQQHLSNNSGQYHHYIRFPDFFINYFFNIEPYLFSSSWRVILCQF